MWRSIPASFWLSMKTQVAFQGCLFGAGVSDMRARLLHGQLTSAVQQKSHPFLPQRLCLEFRTTSNTAIPKLSNAPIVEHSFVPMEKSGVSQCLLALQRAKTAYTDEKHKFFSASFVLPKKKRSSEHAQTFCGMFDDLVVLAKIWVTVRMDANGYRRRP